MLVLFLQDRLVTAAHERPESFRERERERERKREKEKERERYLTCDVIGLM